MNLGLILLLSMMMEGPTVKGLAAAIGGGLGAIAFVTGASTLIITYLLKKRREKH